MSCKQARGRIEASGKDGYRMRSEKASVGSGRHAIRGEGGCGKRSIATTSIEQRRDLEIRAARRTRGKATDRRWGAIEEVAGARVIRDVRNYDRAVAIERLPANKPAVEKQEVLIQ